MAQVCWARRCTSGALRHAQNYFWQLFGLKKLCIIIIIIIIIVVVVVVIIIIIIIIIVNKSIH